MLLSPVQDLLDDLGFDSSNMPNITNAATSALDMAEQQLASALGTQFAQQTLTDTWFVQRPQVKHLGNVRTVFRLSQGFVNSAVAYQAVMFTKLNFNFMYEQIFDEEFNLISGPDRVDISEHIKPLRTTGDVTGYEKGVVVDTHNWFWNKWVKVAYQCGFPVDGTNPNSYDLTVVPQWLQTAAHIAARIALQSNPSLEDPAIKLDTTYMQKQLDVTLAPHVRYVPYALIPDA